MLHLFCCQRSQSLGGGQRCVDSNFYTANLKAKRRISSRSEIDNNNNNNYDDIT